MILRTTHITGLLTDLGTNLGMKLKGHEIAPWKLLVPALLAASFFTGAMFGSMMVILMERPALLVLACMYLAGGIGWSICKRVTPDLFQLDPRSSAGITSVWLPTSTTSNTSAARERSRSAFSNRIGGSPSGSSVSWKVPQCIATARRQRDSRKARTASSGFMCIARMMRRGR